MFVIIVNIYFTSYEGAEMEQYFVRYEREFAISEFDCIQAGVARLFWLQAKFETYFSSRAALFKLMTCKDEFFLALLIIIE